MPGKTFGPGKYKKVTLDTEKWPQTRQRPLSTTLSKC